jgi:DNA adenine methylase
MKPFLKWVGGKTQILDDILSKFPKEMGNYHEPFVGGGSVLLAVCEAKASGKIKINGRIHAYDINEALIGVYKNIQSVPAILMDITNKLFEEYNQSTNQELFYYTQRSRYNEIKDYTLLECSVLFLFLNKCCFRGLYRVGPHGFNVPYGHYKNVQLLPDTFLKYSDILQGVHFECCPFEKSLESPRSGDFVYLDPPYYPVKDKKSFVGYSTKGFDDSQHRGLCQLITELPPKGVDFVCSNSDTDFIRNFFSLSIYMCHEIQCKRAIHSKNPGSKTGELLITFLR